MKLNSKAAIIILIVLTVLSTQGLAGTIRYFNADGVEISAEQYQKEAKTFEIKSRQMPAKQASPSADPILKVIELSGMDQFIKSFPGIIDAQAAQRKLTSDKPEIEDKIAKIIKDAFDPNLASRHLYQFCKNNLDPKTVADALRWYETPLARKITDAENMSSAAEAQPEMLRYIADLQKNPPPPERVEAIQKLVKDAKLVESSVSLFIGVIEGMTSSFNKVLPEEKRASKAEIQKLIANMRPMVEKALQQQIVLSSYYTYRNISNTELEAYTKFLSSASGNRFNETATKAVYSTVLKFFEGIPGKMLSELKT